MASSNKKAKQNLSESGSKGDAADFLRFITIGSLEEVCLAKFSPFLIAARSVVIIVVGNGHGDTSSNPGRD